MTVNSHTNRSWSDDNNNVLNVVKYDILTDGNPPTTSMSMLMR